MKQPKYDAAEARRIADRRREEAIGRANASVWAAIEVEMDTGGTSTRVRNHCLLPDFKASLIAKGYTVKPTEDPEDESSYITW